MNEHLWEEIQNAYVMTKINQYYSFTFGIHILNYATVLPFCKLFIFPSI